MIESLTKKLQSIPLNTPKVKILETLEPLFQELINLDKIVAENFILYSIKEHFKISKGEAQKYISHLNKLRVKSIQINRNKKREEDKLPLITDRDIEVGEAYDAIAEIGIVDIKTLKIIVAIIISAHLRLNPPLWLFLVGVPSSFKTELVGLFSAMNEVYTLDTLTENALASGYVPPDGSEPQDLLPLLDNKTFIIKDLNTLFSMNEEMVKKILGDLTSIFDGKFQKFTATRGLIDYNSLFSMIGCITPSILIKHYSYATQLGPRFLFLRLPELTEKEMQESFKKSWNETNRREKIIKTRQIVSSYTTQLIRKIKDHKNIPEGEEVQNRINTIAKFVCKARGIAITGKATFSNEKGEKIDYFEIKDWQIEHPWRILNQIKSLLRIISFINKKNVVDEEEIGTIKPIILSTMPIERAEILKILVEKCGVSANELAREVGKSSKTIRRTLKELEALKIIDCFKDTERCSSGKTPYLYFIVSEFAHVLGAPVPSPESLSLLKSVIEEGSNSEIANEEDVMENYSPFTKEK